MTMRLRKPMLLLGTTILIMQAVFMPVGRVYAETTSDTEEQEIVELPPMKNYMEEEQVSDPRFFFTRSRMQGVAEEPLQVTFFSDQEVSEARVFLPEEATLLKEQLPTGISVEEGAQPREWIVQSERAQNTFVLPLVFERSGTYELSVEATIVHVEVMEKSSGNMLESSSNPEEENTSTSEENVKEETEESHEHTSSQSSVYVSTWAQYAAAINNQTVTMINVNANISGDTTLNWIDRNLTINGNGFTINSQKQPYVLTGANRQLTVRNAVIMTARDGISAQFTTASSASNALFTFSDITFLGVNRLVASSGDRDTIEEVVFDGGNSQFPDVNSREVLFMNVPSLRLVNQAQIEANGRRLSNFSSSFSEENINRSLLFVEAGSTLSINNSPGLGINGQSMIIEGNVKLHTLQGNPISDSSRRSCPIQIKVESSGQLVIEREDRGPIINTVGPGAKISIAKDANFDFLNKSGGPIANSKVNTLSLDIDSDQFAVWDLGLQEEEKASMVFSNIQTTLSGTNASVIDMTNNDRFQKLYDSSGLASYSRISNRSVEEMTRTVIANFLDTDRNDIAESEVITGLLGDNYQTKGKKISGYQLISSPSNGSGEFSRETIEVSYIYETVRVTPMDPLNPEIKVDPENKPELPEEQGLLSIDFISQFNFGSQAISAHDQTYYAQSQRLLNEDGTVNENEERPNYVQVSDRRSENERNGWQLAVTQKEQFSTDSTNELVGAQLQLMNQQLVTAQGGKEPSLQATNPLKLVPGNKRTLVRAEGNEGTGTWIYRFGNAATAGESVALHVPKGANPEATKYSTTLVWELSAVPGN